MSDPFNFTSANFTPLSLTSPRTPSGGPWTGEYKMQHRVFPNSASSFNSSEFSTGSSRNYRSLNSESFNSEGLNSESVLNRGNLDPNASSGNSDDASSSSVSLRGPNLHHISSIPFNQGSMNAGGFNPGVHSQGVHNQGNLISDAFNPSNVNLPGFSSENLNSPVNSENFSLNVLPRSAKLGSLNAASLNSGDFHSAALNPSHRNTGISQSAWPPSSLSPSRSAFGKAYASRPNDPNPSIPTKGDSASSRPSTLPGLLPDGNNDTFVMDTDDRPEEIISELKLQVESLITAIVMAKSQASGVAASSTLQGADGIEVAHRIMNRLKALRLENEYLGTLVSGKSAAILEAKNKRLESENAMLKEQIREMQHVKESDN